MVIQNWHILYNTCRQRSSLGDKPPAPCTIAPLVERI